ncbi:MAG: LptF/LptG family permease [Flavobacterium sp.]
MKILDKYLLKLFTSTFLTVFVILFFIFILQTVWLFISELAGKDLDFISVIKFLLFATPRVVPLVLPLSVLLASIMTFGSLAENYEFAAMKSSGISLKRAMNSLIVFIGLLSIVAFLFANNVIPYAEYKFLNFRRNIAQLKPAMAIAEGQFSNVGSYTIKVEKKSGNEGRFLDKVTIHKKGRFGSGNNSVIKAESGEIVSSKESNILKLVLNNGNYYEDITPEKYEERKKVPFAKSEFKKYIINIDLSKLNSSEGDNEEITNTNTMLTVSELKYTLDSLSRNYSKDLNSFVDNINDRTAYSGSSYGIGTVMNSQDSTKTKISLVNNSILSNFDKTNKLQILKVAIATVDGISFSLDNSIYEFENKIKNINAHWIALYEKFAIAFSCILMFFLGAPLGAIIRKGGLGLPIVFAVLIFIIYHFINTFGKKLAQENGITPFLGSWMATLLLLPFAVFLTKRATDDKGMMSINLFPFVEWFEKLFPKKNKLILISEISNSIPEAVPVADSTNSLNEKTILITDKKFNLEKTELNKLSKKYKYYSNLGLIINIGLLLLLFMELKNIYLLSLLFILLITCLTYSQQILKRIYTSKEITTPINTYILLIAALPFYFIFYIYNRIALNELQKNNHYDFK